VTERLPKLPCRLLGTSAARPAPGDPPGRRVLLIGPRGFVLDRQQCLKRHRSGVLRTEAFAWSDVRVREYGSTAVVEETVMQRTAYQGPDASGGAARRSARCGRTSAGAAPGANPAARFSPPSDKDSAGGSSRG
jgi:hypothetical protein